MADNDKKRLNIPVSESLHRQVKAMAAQKGETIIQYVVGAIEDKIKGEKKE